MNTSDIPLWEFLLWLVIYSTLLVTIVWTFFNTRYWFLKRKHEQAVENLTEAIRLTAEYTGPDILYPGRGWSWYDALCWYAPEKAHEFAVAKTRRKIARLEAKHVIERMTNDLE